VERFVEEQGFSPALLGGIAAGVVVLGVAIVLSQSDLPDAERRSALLTVLFLPLLLAAVLLFFRLRTQVGHERLVVGFPLGLRRTIPLSEIRSAEPVTYRPLRDFGGWGLRFGRAGMIYSTRGNRAVRLHMSSGKVVFVGSQRPEELAQAISSAR